MTETAENICNGCGSPLKYDIFDDIYNCPVCNRKYRLQPGGTLKLLISKGIEDTNPIAVGKPASSTRERIECPVCGKTNPRENTFRCPQCGKAGICLNHQGESSHLCEICMGEKQRGLQTEIDQAQSYLRELENTPKNNQNKFLSVIKKYSGPEYARGIKNEMFKKNLLPAIAALVSLCASFIGLMNEAPGIFTGGLILSIVMSFISLFNSKSTFREIRENEIKQLQEQLVEKYRLLRKYSPSTRQNPIAPIQYGRVNPAWFQPAWSGGGSVQSYTVETKKPKSGGCSLTFWEVFFIVSVIVGLIIWANQVYPDWNKDFVNSENPSAIVDSCPQEVRQNFYNFRKCVSKNRDGATKPGSMWCEYDKRSSDGDWISNGINMHSGTVGMLGWIPEVCLR